MLPIFHILHDPCILLVLFLKGMVSIDVSCHSKKKKKKRLDFFSIGLTLPCLRFWSSKFVTPSAVETPKACMSW